MVRMWEVAFRIDLDAEQIYTGPYRLKQLSYSSLDMSTAIDAALRAVLLLIVSKVLLGDV